MGNWGKQVLFTAGKKRCNGLSESFPEFPVQIPIRIKNKKYHIVLIYLFPIFLVNWEMSISQKDVKKWKNEGWTFRIKKVKGNKYITRRKGNRERGMGRFDDDLWALIEDSGSEASEVDDKIKLKERVRRNIHRIMAYTMYRTCTHNIDGFCHYIEFDFWMMIKIITHITRTIQ